MLPHASCIYTVCRHSDKIIVCSILSDADETIESLGKFLSTFHVSTLICLPLAKSARAGGASPLAMNDMVYSPVAVRALHARALC